MPSASAEGLPARDPVIERYRQDLDATLIRENLRLTPEERVLKLIGLQRLAEEARSAGRASASPPPTTAGRS